MWKFKLLRAGTQKYNYWLSLVWNQQYRWYRWIDKAGNLFIGEPITRYRHHDNLSWQRPPMMWTLMRFVPLYDAMWHLRGLVPWQVINQSEFNCWIRKTTFTYRCPDNSQELETDTHHCSVMNTWNTLKHII